MWQGLNHLLRQKKTERQWQEVDVRHWVTQYLAAELKSPEVYCESATAGQVIVRVGSALLKQEVLLLEYDLQQQLKRRGRWQLKNLTVRY